MRFEMANPLQIPTLRQLLTFPDHYYPGGQNPDPDWWP